MKVLDLQCGNDHTFEGWFASLDAYTDQCARALVHCPACGDAHITKKLSAPRLNLGVVRKEEFTESQLVTAPSATQQSATAAWMEMARQVVANTDDVGSQFAQEARRIHYGEADARGIRGTSSPDETLELLDEGIAVMPLLLPEALKGPLQ
jgi:hypothetical protein